MKIELFKPTKPWILTQEWGVYSDFYKPFGFTRHNGVDTKIVDRVTLVKAPFDCFVYKIGFQPEGGGLFVRLISKNGYIFPDGKVGRVLVDFLHLHQVLVTPGQNLNVGDDVAVCDNTGKASTGPHLHSQWRRGTYDGTTFNVMDENGANNSFDPEPYFTLFAEDYKNSLTLLGQIKLKVAELLEKYGNSKIS